MKKELIEIFDITQLQFAKSALRHAGVVFEVRNENSLQVGSTYLLGSNGATIWINSSDYEKSKEILIEHNIVTVENAKTTAEFGFVTWIQENLNYGYLEGTSFLFKLTIPFLLIVILSGYMGYQLIYRDIKDFVGIRGWCIEYIEIKGEKIKPMSTAGVNNTMLIEIYDVFGFQNNQCKEKIKFGNGQITLPGINNQKTAGIYKFNNDHTELDIKLINKDINAFYEGNYKVEFNNFNHNGLLISEKIVIKFQLYE